MLSVNLETRHWTPQQEYAAGDHLLGLLSDGWRIESADQAHGESRAPMYDVTLRRDGEIVSVRVLDGPAARRLLAL